MTARVETNGGPLTALLEVIRRADDPANDRLGSRSDVSEVTAPQPASNTEQRRAALDQVVANFAQMGYRVESRSEFQATLVKGHRTNHILHLILTIVTLGIWAFVWIGMALFGGEERRVVTIDPTGKSVVTKSRG